MGSLTDLLQPVAAPAWLLLPSALALGILHGLEPGHSKTMMTAFIIAVRGTIAQAVLLGLAATVSHTSVVWAVALLGMHFGSQYDDAIAEPYFRMVSAFLIIAIALWMLRRTWREQRRVAPQRRRMRTIITMASITHIGTPMSWPMPTRSGAGSPPEM